MPAQSSTIPGGEKPRTGGITATLVGTGAAASGVVLGAGAAYLLTQASAEALAATSRALLTTGVAGLVLMAAVVAVRLLVRRHGRGDRPPGERIPTHPMRPRAAELFLVRDGGQLRPLPARAPGDQREQRRSA